VGCSSMVDGLVERARARVRAAELELERAKVDLARLEVERAAVPAFHVSQESQWGAGLPPPLLEVVVRHVLGWEDRAMSAAFRAVCTTWNAAHDALCSRLAPLLWDGRREVTHEAKWLTRFPQVCFLHCPWRGTPTSGGRAYANLPFTLLSFPVYHSQVTTVELYLGASDENISESSQQKCLPAFTGHLAEELRSLPSLTNQTVAVPLCDSSERHSRAGHPHWAHGARHPR
jgi:hypothetical protein